MQPKMGLLDTEPINSWRFMKLSIALYFGNFIHIFGIRSSTESICLAGGLKIPGSRRPVFLPGLLCAWAVESQRSPTLSCNLRCCLTGDKRATLLFIIFAEGPKDCSFTQPCKSDDKNCILNSEPSMPVPGQKSRSIATFQRAFWARCPYFCASTVPEMSCI